MYKFTWAGHRLVIVEVCFPLMDGRLIGVDLCMN